MPVKIDAGAEYAITQPIFDVESLLAFCDEVARHPRPIPIVAGVYPLVSFRNADFMNNHVPGVVVPRGILDRMSRCKTKQDGIEAGIEIAREIRQALAGRVAGFQVSAPFGRIDVALKVLAE